MKSIQARLSRAELSHNLRQTCSVLAGSQVSGLSNPSWEQQLPLSAQFVFTGHKLYVRNKCKHIYLSALFSWFTLFLGLSLKELIIILNTYVGASNCNVYRFI